MSWDVPATTNAVAGLVVPVPTLPLFLSTRNNHGEVPTANNAQRVGFADAIYKDPANDEVAVVEVELI